LTAFNTALGVNIPEIINSDQGCQFTSKAWMEALERQGILISMDGKGRAIDNIYIERFWRSIKYEERHLKSPGTVSEAKKVIEEYIVYNNHRPHQSLDYKTPAMVYFSETVDMDMMDKFSDAAHRNLSTYPQPRRLRKVI